MKTRGHLHGELSGWESAYESLAFTVDALGAIADDAELTKLAARVSAQLTDWEAIEADRRRLRRAVIHATARARVADARLDVAIGAFAADLLSLVGNDAEHATYKRYFTEPHEDIIALGLDSELPMVTLILHALDGTTDAPEKLLNHRAPLRAALQLGNGSLAGRSDALADLGRHSARIDAWRESAEATLRSLHRALSRVAEERKHPAPWVESFFG